MQKSGQQPGPAKGPPSPSGRRPTTTKGRGDQAEAFARAHLQQRGLRWLESNFRTPGRGGGEIDLIMREPDGTLVFVEVRQRSAKGHGGAGASIGAIKQRRIVYAARHYLARLTSVPPCRFDVVLIDGAIDGVVDRSINQGGARLTWLKGAFEAF
jgi:putative endonuclease